MSEWQKIDENTPRMRTILMWGETGSLGIVMNWKIDTGFIHAYDGVGPEEIVWGGKSVQEWDHKPTHWQHIPKPPAFAHNPEKEEWNG